MNRVFSVFAYLAIPVALSACRSARPDPVLQEGTAPVSRTARGEPAPTELMGAFVDDYDGQYIIDDSIWRHGQRTRYHVVRWHTREQFLIARNDEANPSDGGRFTRIDWMRLEGMMPYTWAYCISTWNADSPASAAAAAVADRASPRTGCNRFPFSRMRRAP